MINISDSLNQTNLSNNPRPKRETPKGKTKKKNEGKNKENYSESPSNKAL